MIVSQLDADGYFLGPTEADQSPLEPGVYLLPAGAVEASPPTIPHGFLAKWIGGDWTFEAPEPVVLPAAPPQLTEQELRQQFVNKAQTLLDLVARLWGYDNIFTACTYADEPAIAHFQAEGQALRRYRSEFWAAAYALVPGPGDTIDALLAQLPAPPERPVTP